MTYFNYGVCELPDALQKAILASFETEMMVAGVECDELAEAMENCMDSKVCDLRDYLFIARLIGDTEVLL